MTENEKPAVVLVHGAYADGSSWSEVTGRLRFSRRLVVPTGETAVLPWMHDRMGQPAARAAAARHGAGLGARLPVRRVRTRVPAFRVRAGMARAAEASRRAGTPQVGCRHPRPAGTCGEPV